MSSNYEYPFHGSWKLTCPFGKQGSWACGWHTGVDYVGQSDRNVYAVSDGTVSKITTNGSYGHCVYVKHDDGMLSVYAHLKAGSIAVKANQKVTGATKLGVMGASGNANGAHLHLELHQGSYRYPPSPRIDPDAYISQRRQNESEEQTKLTSEEMERVETMEEITIKVNGIPLAQKGFLKDGLSYAPVRALGEALSMAVSWRDDERTACLDRWEITICVDGQYIDGGFLIDHSGFGPVRAIAESLGAEVTWEDDSHLVQITT